MTSKEKKPIVRCPLCGATLDGHTLILQASEQMVDSELGVLGGRCPYCQGRLEMLPSNDQIELGYLRDGARFITLETLNCPGLQVWRDGEALEVSLAGKTMRFTIDLDE